MDSDGACLGSSLKVVESSIDELDDGYGGDIGGVAFFVSDKVEV